jgi:methyl-accepting chemotaxis protein
MAEAYDQNPRLAFLELNTSDRPLLQEARGVIEPHIDRILDAFYTHLMATPETAKLFKTHGRMQHARDMQRKHWMDAVFSGEFDAAYFEKADRIGRVHERVGLDPRWYLGGYAFVIKHLEEVVMRAYRRRPDRGIAVMSAVTRALFLDMDIVITSYDQTARERTAGLLEDHARSFQNDVIALVEIVAAAATELQNTATAMRSASDATVGQVGAVSDAAHVASDNVRMVASASEALDAAIDEINRQVAESTRIAHDAVAQADRGNAMVGTLAEAADRIGAVVRFITEIAGQTNLLALNATIEAARAGDSGKGFVVVANEVKTLAGQTAKATKEISSQVGAVQSATSETVQAIRSIGETISRISGIGDAIAAAVEEQGRATHAITENVDQASAATRDVASNIGGVRDMAHDTGKAADQVQDAASDLARHAEVLRSKVDQFLARIRVAMR